MQPLRLNGIDVALLPINTTIKNVLSNKACNNTKSIDHDDAFFVCDLADVIRKMKIWKEELPRVQPFYAVKCNEDPALLGLLAELGANFDCASKMEIKRILAMGVSPERIIFANPCKQSSFIKYAANENIKRMTFDNETELYKIKELFPSAELVIRVMTDDSKSICRLGMKFGCHPHDALSLLKVAQSLSLNVIGVSFHVGSGCYDAVAYSDAIQIADQVFADALQCDYTFTLLDIGGGYPGHVNSKITFEEITKEINSALDKYFPESRGVAVIAEPGRYFAASAFHLATNVIARRFISNDDVTGDNHHYMYYINDGVYGSFNCLLYDHQEVEAIPLKTHPGDGIVTKSSVWGPTCDGLDVIHENILLPKLEIGDWLTFENMGAYTMCAGSEFNGMPKPQVYYVMKQPNVPLTHKCVIQANLSFMSKYQEEIAVV